MNTAEIKLELFRGIDKLPDADLENIYNKVKALLDATSRYKLNKFEKKAIEEALEEREKGNIVSHENVVNEAKKKFPKLKFKFE